MSVQIDVLFSGFSGKLEVGYLGWGTWALLRDGTHTMVLDTGFVGLRQNYNEILGKYGVSPQDVDHVLLTHLHFDHACNVDRYPNAQFVVSRQEWEYANSAGRDLFIEDAAVRVLRDSGRLRLVEDGEEVVPGITAMLTPGHTPGSCSYIVRQDGGETWVLAGDAAKNRGELLTEEVQMSMDAPATQSSLRRIKAAGTRVLPGHDGWVTLKEGEVLAEGGNDKRLVFGQGITINGGNREMLLHMD